MEDEESHLVRLCGPSVECHRIFAAGDSTELGDDGIGEVGTATTCGERGSDDRVAVDSELPGIEKALDQLGTASGTDLVGASQHPVQLDDGDQAEETRVVLAQHVDHHGRRCRLSRFVLNQVADDDVGIEPDHGTEVVAPAAMASSMSSRVTSPDGRGTAPLRSWIDAACRCRRVRAGAGRCRPVRAAHRSPEREPPRLARGEKSTPCQRLYALSVARPSPRSSGHR